MPLACIAPTSPVAWKLVRVDFSTRLHLSALAALKHLARPASGSVELAREASYNRVSKDNRGLAQW